MRGYGVLCAQENLLNATNSRYSPVITKPRSSMNMIMIKEQMKSTASKIEKKRSQGLYYRFNPKSLKLWDVSQNN